MTPKLVRPFKRWYQRRQTRLALSHMDPMALKDIGLVRMGHDYITVSPWADRSEDLY